MKILYVENNPIHRMLTKEGLERRGHIVDLFLYARSTYAHSDCVPEIPRFQDAADLVGIVQRDAPEVMLLDCESFCPDPSDECNSDVYAHVKAVLDAQYSGQVILTTTMGGGMACDVLQEYGLADKVSILSKATFGVATIQELMMRKACPLSR